MSSQHIDDSGNDGLLADLFAHAAELSPDHRAAYLDHACAGNASLRAEVGALLLAHDSHGHFLDHPVALGPPIEIAGSDLLTKQIGPYTIRAVIGEGAFGVVYLAEQKKPIRRRVLRDDHPDTLSSINNMGELLKAQGKLSEAEPYQREAMEKYRLALTDEHPSTLNSINNMGNLLVRTTRYAEAVALLVPAEGATRSAFTGDNAPRLASFLLNLGKARAGIGQTSEFAVAESNLLEAQSISEQTCESIHQCTRECALALIDLYSAWHVAEPDNGYDKKVAGWRTKLNDLHSVTHSETMAPAPTAPSAP